jgi:hypothetical protein
VDNELSNTDDKEEDEDDDERVCTFDGCGKRFETPLGARRHKREKHSEKIHRCAFDGCDQRFSTPWFAKLHWRRTHTEEVHLCKVDGCGKKFTRHDFVLRHEKVHCIYLCTFETCKYSRAGHGLGGRRELIRHLDSHGSYHLKGKHTKSRRLHGEIKSRNTATPGNRIHDVKTPARDSIDEMPFQTNPTRYGEKHMTRPVGRDSFRLAEERDSISLLPNEDVQLHQFVDPVEGHTAFLEAHSDENSAHDSLAGAKARAFNRAELGIYEGGDEVTAVDGNNHLGVLYNEIGAYPPVLSQHELRPEMGSGENLMCTSGSTNTGFYPDLRGHQMLQTNYLWLIPGTGQYTLESNERSGSGVHSIIYLQSNLAVSVQSLLPGSKDEPHLSSFNPEPSGTPKHGDEHDGPHTPSRAQFPVEGLSELSHKNADWDFNLGTNFYQWPTTQDIASNPDEVKGIQDSTLDAHIKPSPDRGSRPDAPVQTDRPASVNFIKPSQPPQTTRKRVRTVDGSCLGCTKRRVKCDLTLPACQKCTEQNTPCWYGLRWIEGVASRGRLSGKKIPILSGSQTTTQGLSRANVDGGKFNLGAEFCEGKLDMLINTNALVIDGLQGQPSTEEITSDVCKAIQDRNLDPNSWSAYCRRARHVVV